MAIEDRLKKSEGSTATTVLLLNDELYLAYVGDSAAILVQGDKAIELCPELDVAASNAEEVERINKSNGVVLPVGSTMRVQGELALTRSLGALKYEPYVIPDPHICRYRLKEEQNSFLVVASDGLWKVLTSTEVAKIAAKHDNEIDIINSLHEEAIKRNSTDNITIVVINLEKRQKVQMEETFEGSPSSISH